MLENERQIAMTMKPHRVAQIFRARFARTAGIVYIGHLDLMRTFERVCRRAEFPILYSQGYNPRPSMVFALPLGVGVATTSDYVDIFLEERIDAAIIISRFNQFCPNGLRLLEGGYVSSDSGSLMAEVSAATYHIASPNIREYTEKLLQRDSIMVMKRSKGKMKEAEIRDLFLEVSQEESEPHSISITVLAGSSRNLRPDLFLEAMSELEAYPSIDKDNAMVTRTALFMGEYPHLEPLSKTYS
ncbi:MAG: DUF2344 domain-containing protein [Clostridiaceae bacterium]|nr:DUF2344 domain-containing protein [Clostridiaceae bacterium]